MVDVNAFTRALEVEVDKVDKVVFNTTKQLAILTYKTIQRLWPAHTYYSLMNNRVNINGQDITEVDPPERPTYKGALAHEAAIEFSIQLSKLEGLKPSKKGRIVVVIGNAVDYAPDVSFTPGGGRAIYERAAAIASAGVHPSTVPSNVIL